jgi:probable phosphoglycerate mutase
MKTILLIRHGHNPTVGVRLTGRLPGINLNELGNKQALCLAHNLASLPIAAIYSSPLERTRETAAPLAEALHLPVIIDEGLQEVDFGIWSGQTLKQFARKKMWQTVMTRASQAQCPGGESYTAARDRVVAAVEHIRMQTPEGSVAVCVSHCDTLRLALTHYLHMPLDEFHRLTLDPASVTILCFASNQVRVGYINLPPETANSIKIG